MTFILGLLIMIAAVLLILAVMVQNSKGGGLDMGNSMVNNMGNIDQSTDTIEKVTWYLAAFIAVACIASSFMGPSTGSGKVTSEGFDGTSGTNTTMPQQ